ncbi:MAG: ergothioneine biosynthesis protein EgtB [Acidobacteriota bacterium]
MATSPYRSQTLYYRTRLDIDSVLQRFRDVRRFSEFLCEPLKTEDYVVQSMPDASPTRWHLAHTSWFFEAFLLAPHLPGYESPNPMYAYLFNSYYVQAGERYPRPQRGLVTRPTVQEVFDYRQHVGQAVQRLLEGASAVEAETIVPIVELGTHHEQQHQELLLTDLKHLFSKNPLGPVYQPPSDASHERPKVSGWVDFAGGLQEVGHTGNGFCYDNELPRHRSYLVPFRLADRLVTNAEFTEFIADGGYRTPTLWLDEGWQTASSRGWEAPLYWQQRDGEWHHFTLGGHRRVDPDEPVCHISFYEADAFARWAGARLPREEEWETAAASCGIEGNFVESGRYHPAATRPSGRLDQIFGDVWEWTASPYTGYPGYQPSPGAIGEYNGKFMVNQMVLRGGSCATSQTHIRPTYRNFFHPDLRWQFSGIRLARDV